MHKSILIPALVILVSLLAATADAQKDRFVGTFVTADSKTGGITRLTLGDDDTVNVWGRCHPRDCDWGTENTIAYAPSAGAELRSSATAMSAVYVKGFATKIVIIRPLDENRLRVDVFTHFTDRSGRTDYAAKQVLVREGTLP